MYNSATELRLEILLKRVFARPGNSFDNKNARFQCNTFLEERDLDPVAAGRGADVRPSLLQVGGSLIGKPVRFCCQRLEVD